MSITTTNAAGNMQPSITDNANFQVDKLTYDQQVTAVEDYCTAVTILASGSNPEFAALVEHNLNPSSPLIDLLELYWGYQTKQATIKDLVPQQQAPEQAKPDFVFNDETAREAQALVTEILTKVARLLDDSITDHNEFIVKVEADLKPVLDQPGVDRRVRLPRVADTVAALPKPLLSSANMLKKIDDTRILLNTLKTQGQQRTYGSAPLIAIKTPTPESKEANRRTLAGVLAASMAAQVMIAPVNIYQKVATQRPNTSATLANLIEQAGVEDKAKSNSAEVSLQSWIDQKTLSVANTPPLSRTKPDTKVQIEFLKQGIDLRIDQLAEKAPVEVVAYAKMQATILKLIADYPEAFTADELATIGRATNTFEDTESRALKQALFGDTNLLSVGQESAIAGLVAKIEFSMSDPAKQAAMIKQSQALAHHMAPHKAGVHTKPHPGQPSHVVHHKESLKGANIGALKHPIHGVKPGDLRIIMKHMIMHNNMTPKAAAILTAHYITGSGRLLTAAGLKPLIAVPNLDVPNPATPSLAAQLNLNFNEITAGPQGLQLKHLLTSPNITDSQLTAALQQIDGLKANDETTDLGRKLDVALATPATTEASAHNSINPASDIPADIKAIIEKDSVNSPHFAASDIAGQIKVESNFRADATSPVGATGLAQFMPDTWAGAGIDGNHDGVKDPNNPEDAIAAQISYDNAQFEAMATFLADHNIHGVDIKAAEYMAYNWGINNVESFLRDYNRLPTSSDIGNQFAFNVGSIATTHVVPQEAVDYAGKIIDASRQYIPVTTSVESHQPSNEHFGTVGAAIDELMKMGNPENYAPGPQKVVAVAVAEQRKHILESPLYCDTGNTSAVGTCGPEIDKYTGGHLEYWCEDAVQWILKEGGMQVTAQTADGRSPSVDLARGNYENGKDGLYTTNLNTTHPGDVIFFNEHVGLILAEAGDYFVTFQGNTTYAGFGNNGVAATIKVVSKSNANIVGYGHPTKKVVDAPSVTAAPAPPAPPAPSTAASENKDNKDNSSEASKPHDIKPDSRPVPQDTPAPVVDASPDTPATQATPSAEPSVAPTDTTPTVSSDRNSGNGTDVSHNGNSDDANNKKNVKVSDPADPTSDNQQISNSNN